MALGQVLDYLNRRKAHYRVVPHRPANTAQELAAQMHVHGWRLAKPVLLKADGRYVLALLPAPFVVDFARVRALLGGAEITLASEEDLRLAFPDSEAGATPPFGNLYGVPVIVEEKLAAQDSIVFSAGSRREAIQMGFEEFRQLANPIIAHFGVPAVPTSMWSQA